MGLFPRPAPALILLLTAAPALAQQPADRPVLRVRSYSVVVDVVVTDDNNRHVGGLGKEDFRVYEDGVLQQIDSFRSISPQQARAGTERGALVEVEEIPRHRESDFNLLMVLLDYATTEYLNQSRVAEAAARYVEERMEPNDLMAVFRVGRTLRFLQGFTDRREDLLAALGGRDSSGSAYALDQSILGDRAQNAQDQVENLTAAVNALTPGAPGTGFAAAAVARILNRQLEMAQALEGRYYATISRGREQQSRPVIGAIETIARGVRHIPGRKTLILFSQGFAVPLTVEKALYRAVEEANKSNLAIYSIDAGGLQTRPIALEGELYDISATRSGDRVQTYGGLSQFDRAREIGSDQKDSTLRYISNATGGFLIRHTNDFLKALDTIDADVRSHYVLTYQPGRSDFDGEFRTIRVEVNLPQVMVRARPGYWAVPPGAALLSADEYRSLIATEDREQKLKPRRLQFFCQPDYFLTGEDRYSLNLAVEVPLAQLSPYLEAGRQYVNLHLVGLVRDERGEVITSLRGPSRFSLPEGRAPEVEHLRLESRIDLAPGRYALELLVEDPASRARGRRSMSLTLQPPDGLRTSSLVLGRDDEMVRGQGEDEFTVDGVRVTPSARRRFSNGDRLIYLLNVYRADAVHVETALWHQGRKINSSGKTVGAVRLEEPVPHLRVARYLDLKGLPAGYYVLRALVSDPATGESHRTQTGFRIE